MKSKKRFSVMILGLLLGMMLFSVPVFAATPENVPVTQESVPVEKKSTPLKTESTPLTPDGNLTLVDDIGSEESSGKQFITLVTKNGNYFYLIIDRDDEGKETVHFLNQVDEADLLSLMEEEEIEALRQDQTKEISEEEVLLEIPEEETITAEEPKTDSQRKMGLSFPAILSGAVVIGGCVAFAVLKMKEKKRTVKTESEEAEDAEEYYDFMDLEKELNGEGLDEDESI